MVKGGLVGGTGLQEPVSQALRPHLLIPDLQDMSLVTLSTKTPRDFFTKHQLVLHVAKSEMDKVRVFQARRELSLAVMWVFPSCPSM